MKLVTILTESCYEWIYLKVHWLRAAKISNTTLRFRCQHFGGDLQRQDTGSEICNPSFEAIKISFMLLLNALKDKKHSSNYLQPTITSSFMVPKYLKESKSNKYHI